MLQKAFFTAGQKPVDVVMCVAQSPFVVAYPWSPNAGYGVKYSDPSPAIFTQATALATRVDAAPNGRTLFISGYYDDGGTNRALITAIRWGASGFGTKYSSPSLSGSNVSAQSVAVSPAGDIVVTVGSFSGEVAAYPWSDSTGFGSRFSDPTLTLSLEPQFCRFNSSGSVVGISRNSGADTNQADFFPISGSGFGTRFSNPSTAIGTEITSFRFTASDNAIVFGNGDSATSNYFYAYAWSGSGFGAAYSSVSYTSNRGPVEVAFSPDGTKLVFCRESVTGQAISTVGYVSWNSSTGPGSTITFPATRVSAAFTGLDFSPGGESLVLSVDGSPYIYAYRWSSSGFGSPYSNPSVLPTRAGINPVFVERV